MPLAVAAPRRGGAAGLSRAVGFTVRRQRWLMGLGLSMFAAVWLSHLALTSLSPPVDNIEQLTWVASLEWGYYKHPPLPTWLIWLPVKVFGPTAWASYSAGAACTLTAMALMWHLLLKIRGARYACVALLAALCITYYNGRLNYFNHNIVLMLLSAGSASLCWQAFSTRQLRWWLGLGVALGLGALTKYQVAVTVASVLVFALHQRAWRDPHHRIGALLACLAALLIFTPHIFWLRGHDFGPIRYAIESSLGAHVDLAERLFESMNWIADQILNRALPALILLAMVALPLHTARSRPPLTIEATPQGDAARSLLLAWGLVPLVFMPLIGLLVGADLQLQWGTAFILFAVPAAMELLPPETWKRADLRKAWAAFVSIQALLLALSYLTSPHGPAPLRHRYWRTFDSALLAHRVAGPARAELGGPIRILIGDGAKAGALALQLPEQPLVLIDGRFDFSPWVTSDLLQRCGAVRLVDDTKIPGTQPVGDDFPKLAWYTIAPRQSAPPCPAKAVGLR